MSFSVRSLSLMGLVLAGMVGLPAIQAADEASPSARLGWKLSLQAWTAHYTTLWETLDIAKQAGIHYIELYPGQPIGGGIEGKFDHNSPPEIRAKVQARLAELGIQPIAYGVVGLPKEEAGSRRVFEFAKAMGIEVINSEPSKDAYDTVERLIKEFDIKVGIHNHPMPTPYWNPDTVLKAVVGRDPRFGACADTGHWPRSAMPAIDCLRKYTGRIESTHLKDTDKIGLGAKDVVFGTGANGTAVLLAEYKAQGFHGPMSIEYEAGKKGDELIADLKTMVAFVERTAAELQTKP
jgi:sugar phosphate isomerase/epimerase